MTAFVLCAVSSNADTLDETVRAAQKRSPEIAAARARWEAKKAQALIPLSLPDPMVGADFMRDGTTSFTDLSKTEYMVQQDVPGFGKRAARSGSARQMAEAEGFRYLETARSVRSRAAQAWWDLWEKQQAVEIAADTAALMAQVERTALDRYAAGRAQQVEVLRAGMEAARMSNEVATLRAEVVVAQHRIDALLNEPSATPRRADGALSRPPMPAAEDAAAQGRQWSCTLAALRSEQEAREAELRMARIDRRPDFQFRVNARQIEGQGGIAEYDTGVFLNLPWPARGKYKAVIAAAKASVDEAAQELAAGVAQTTVEIRESYTMSESALREVTLYEKTLLPKAEQVVHAASAAHQTGQAELTDVLDAMRSWRDMKKSWAAAVAAYGQNRAMLDERIAPWGAYEYDTGVVTSASR